jgi:hypothetical protein
MKKTFFAISGLFILISSCSKSNPGTSSNVNPTAHTYQNLTAGSTWQYELIDNSGTSPDTSDYSLTATSGDTTINNRVYNIFLNVSDTGNAEEYYYVNSDNYYQFEQLPSLLGGGSIEELYLKDNQSVNATWSQTTNVNIDQETIPLTITDSIVGTNLTRTVNDSIYNNVIHVSSHVTSSTISAFPGSSLTSNMQYYYAPDYGLIEADVYISLNVPLLSISQIINTQTKIISASLK